MRRAVSSGGRQGWAHVTFELCDAAHTGLPDGSADVVTSRRGPLITREFERVLRPGGAIGVGLLDRVLLVGGMAVIGDDHPVEPVLRTCLHLLHDGVHRVIAVVGVDMVVAGRSLIPPGATPDSGCCDGAIARTCQRATEDTTARGCGTHQSQSAQELAAAQVHRAQVAVRNGRVRYGSRSRGRSAAW